MSPRGRQSKVGRGLPKLITPPPPQIEGRRNRHHLPQEPRVCRWLDERISNQALGERVVRS